MKRFFLATVFLCSILLIGGRAYSQIPEDALRLSTPNLGVGARSLGMGTAYTGVASDFSAMFTNPAGLGQIRLSEVSFGLSNLSYNNSSTYLSNPSSFSNSSTSINNIGFVYPFPTVRGSMVFAVAYGRNADYASALSFHGFNRSSSIIPSLDPNMISGLFLQDGLGNIPYVDSMDQQGKVLEEGATNNWTVSGAIEAANNLYLGISLNFISGSYTYNRTYAESDIKNKYVTPPYPDSLALFGINLQNTINDDISGFSARLGLLYKINSKARFGVSVKTPTWYSITETFTDDGSSHFRFADVYGYSDYSYISDNSTQYDVKTPFVFAAGLSYDFGPLMLTGDVEHTDWTQMSFSNADPQVINYNTDIKEWFRATTNFRVGGEFEIPTLNGFRIRGGYAYLPSPYKDDISGADQKFITGGLGFIVENSVAFDIGYARGWWETSHVQYDGAPATSEKITTDTIIGTILYRF